MKDLKDVMEALTILLVFFATFGVLIFWLKRKAKRKNQS